MFLKINDFIKSTRSWTKVVLSLDSAPTSSRSKKNNKTSSLTSFMLNRLFNSFYDLMLFGLDDVVKLSKNR